MNDVDLSDVDRHLDDLQKHLAEHRRLLADIEKGRRRAAIFRKLGVGRPLPALISARQKIIVRRFDGRGLRRRDRLALGALHWMIDRCEMLEGFGTLGNIFDVRW